MNTVELCNLLTHHCRRIGITFYGVFAMDQLNREAEEVIQRQQRGHKEGCLVLNTHPINKAGEHWLAVYFYKPRPSGKFMFCVCFDSFGLPLHLTNAQLYQFVQRHAHNIRYNSRQVQPQDSYACGAFCVFFIFMLARYDYNVNALVCSEFSDTDGRYNVNKVLRFVFALIRRGRVAN